MKKYLFFLAILFLATSCNKDAKQAEGMLNEARSYYEAHEYATAKLFIDSLKKTYPKEPAIQRKGLQLMREVDLAEQERNLSYCDSMLIVCLAKSDSLKKNFVFEKDPTYDDVGKFIAKKQVLEKNLQKSYIRCNVNERGEMYLASVYYGANPINHNQLKITSPDGGFTETDIIPRDGGLNYTFKDMGTTTEVVSYMKGKDGGVIQFICDRQHDKLKAEYLGGKSYSFQMTAADKEAVAEINELATVLSDIERLKKEIQKAQSRIEYLKGKTNTDQE